MSLHAQLSPEVLADLRRQKRNNAISSFFIALLTITLVGVVFAMFFLEIEQKDDVQIVSYQAAAREETVVERKQITRTMQQPTAAPSVSNVITANTSANISIPTVEIEPLDLAVDFGELDDFSDNWNEVQPDNTFEAIPSEMRVRCSREDRMARLSQNGGVDECETAVVKGLRWLKKNQNKDGSWGDRNHCGMTALAVLAYLGHCDTPDSREFGETVTKGITFLINYSLENDGRFVKDTTQHAWVYETPMVAYALAESYTFCSNLGITIPNLEEVTKRVGDWMLSKQHRSGSWDYGYDTRGQRGGDNSIGFWHIQALKACMHTGIWEKRIFNTPINRALRYIADTQQRDGAIGYRANADRKPGLTGGGLLAYQMWGRSDDRVAQRAADHVIGLTKFNYNSPTGNLYDHYYNAQAMINVGGSHWEKYNAIFRDQVLQNQNEDGSWKIPGGGKQIAHGGYFTAQHKSAEVYRTCLNIFMLEVYYRFLPGTGGEDEH